jgi:hypothetical protein
MKKKPIQDKDLLRARRAILDAAADARTIAYQTNTPLVVYEKGRVVKKWMTEKDLQ